MVILTEPEHISDRIRNYFVSVDCIAERCYGYFIGLCIFGGEVLKIKRGHCVQKVHLGDIFVLRESVQKQKKLMC